MKANELLNAYSQLVSSAREQHNKPVSTFNWSIVLLK